MFRKITSDVGAIELMELAWGRIQDRNLEQIEIIDIKSKDLLKKLDDSKRFRL